jgi:hypothetical protein
VSVVFRRAGTDAIVTNHRPSYDAFSGPRFVVREVNLLACAAEQGRAAGCWLDRLLERKSRGSWTIGPQAAGVLGEPWTPALLWGDWLYEFDAELVRVEVHEVK